MTEAAIRSEAALLRRSRPYSEYRNSGVSWLGQIPSHWEVKRLGLTVTACQNGVWGSEADGIADTLCVRVADFDRLEFRVNLNDPTVRSVEPELAKARRLRQGDLLLEKSGGGEKQPVGAVVVYDHQEPAVCSNFVARMPVSNSFHPRYLTYLHASLYAARINTRSIKQSTGIQNLDSASYLSEPVGLPDGNEQRAIAAFLDRETAKIDTLVTKKERLIDLLQEKRTALVTSAVTRGLDPNVPTKDSGVEWLGEIPAHWEIAPVYARYRVALGKMLDAKRITGESPGKYLRNVDVQWDIVNVEDLPQMDFRPSERNRYLLRPGDLLVCEGGEVGRTAMWSGELDECFYQKAIHRVRPRSQGEVPRFFYFLMRALAGRGVFTAGGNANTIDHLTAVQLRHYRMPFPSSCEQDAIVDFLDRETASIDALVGKIDQAIALLLELRTALVSAAVTGKIDVREARPR